MATSKGKSAKSSNPTDPQMTKIFEQAEEGIRPNITAFCNWVKDLGGPEMSERDVQIVISGYKNFQRSDAAKAYRSEVAGSREEEKAAREAAREQKRAAAEAKKAEAKAAKEATAAKATKATKGKTAAAASVPKATKGKATASKTTAAATPAKAATKASKKGKATKAAF